MSTSQDRQRYSHTSFTASKMQTDTAGIFKKESHRESFDHRQMSQKKLHTPNRSRGPNSGTSKMVDQLKESVFQIARDQENSTSAFAGGSPKKLSSPQKRSSPQKQPQGTLTDSTNNHNVAFGRSSANVSPMAGIQINTNQDVACTNFATVDYSRPESPCKLSVQPQMFNKQAQQSPRGSKVGKGCSQSAAKRPSLPGGGPRTPNSSRRNKSKKFGLQCNGNPKDANQLNVMRQQSTESNNLMQMVPVEQLEKEFMRRAELQSDQNFEASKNDPRAKDLEIIQLQNALGALSEKLKLFQNIDSERELISKQLSEVHQARSDLKKVLHETTQKTQTELSKMEQYQEILLKENQAVSAQLMEQRTELNSKVEACDKLTIQNSLMKKEIETLKLQLADLSGYKEKYEKTASTTLKTQTTQLQDLHTEIEKITIAHAQQMEQVHQDKEVLIQQNAQLKQALSDSMNGNEQLKSQVESFHGKLINVEAQLESERKQIAKMKACQGDFGQLEDELRDARAHNSEISAKVEELVQTMQREQSLAESKLSSIMEEKATTDSENHSLNNDIKNKDEIIKRLTKENLLINSKVTQLQKLLCEQEDQDSAIAELNEFVDTLNKQREELKGNYEKCSNKLLEVEEKCQETQTTCMQLLQHCKIKDEEIERLHDVIDELQEKVDDQLFIYKPLKDDPVDQGLANYINKAPVRIRSKMDFERESQGIYRYHRKKVFMKIEQETIVIRVGGGFLTLDEFVALYCGGEVEQQKKITNLVYGGKCAGSKEFKQFYFSQQTVPQDQHGGSKTPQPRVDTHGSDNTGATRATTPNGIETNGKWTVDETHRDKSNPRRR